MKNLKKVLALVLAFACAFTMFASAANFTDQADIDRVDAVNMLTSLGVIEGYDDGSFQPQTIVTRIQMAALIFRIRNNLADDSTAYQNIDSPFQDIPANDESVNWGRGAVNFCWSQGIIAGRSDEVFDPKAEVTGVEAAKMLLVVAGYDADKAGLTGSNWKTNTLKWAGQAGLLDEVTAPLEEGLPREYAAQMIYNALETTRVKWSDDSNSFDDVLNGGVKETVGRAYMGLYRTAGILVSISGNEIGLANLDEAESDATGYNNSSDHNTYTTSFTKVDTDYSDLLGQKVKVLFKDGKANSVLGVYPMSDNSAVTVYANEIEADDEKVKFGGTSYSVENGYGKNYIDVYFTSVTGSNTDFVYNADATTAQEEVTGSFTSESNVTFGKGGNGYTHRGFYTGVTSGVPSFFDNWDTSAAVMTFVDSDANGKFDALIITDYKAAEVTSVSSSKLIAGKSYNFADENIDEGFAKEDWAIISWDRYNDCQRIQRADVVSETLNGLKKNSTSENYSMGTGYGVQYHEYQLGSSWYNQSTGNNNDINTVQAGDSVTAVIVNGIVCKIKRVSDGSLSDVPDVALIVSKDSGIGGDQVKLQFFNDTTKVVDVDSDSSIAYEKLVIGQLYEYSVSGGEYSFEPLETQDDYYGEFTYKGTATYQTQSSAISGMTIDDKARVILWKQISAGDTSTDGNGNKISTWATGDSDVITGKQLKTLKASQIIASASDSSIVSIPDVEWLSADVSGLTRAAALVVTVDTLPSGLTSNDYYGFIMSDASESASNEVQYDLLIQGSDEVIHVYEKNARTSERKKRQLIGYKTLDDEDSDKRYIDDVKLYSISAEKNADGTWYLSKDTNFGLSAITSTNSSKTKIQIANLTSTSGSDFEVNSDTVLFFIDTDDMTGNSTDSASAIQKADKWYDQAVGAKIVDSDGEAYVGNCLYLTDGTDELDVLVVETGDGNFRGPYRDAMEKFRTGTGYADDIGDITTILNSNSIATLTGSLNSGESVSIANGKTLNISSSATVDANAVITILSGGTLTTANNISIGTGATGGLEVSSTVTATTGANGMVLTAAANGTTLTVHTPVSTDAYGISVSNFYATNGTTPVTTLSAGETYTWSSSTSRWVQNAVSTTTLGSVSLTGTLPTKSDSLATLLAGNYSVSSSTTGATATLTQPSTITSGENVTYTVTITPATGYTLGAAPAPTAISGLSNSWDDYGLSNGSWYYKLTFEVPGAATISSVELTENATVTTDETAGTTTVSGGVTNNTTGVTVTTDVSAWTLNSGVYTAEATLTADAGYVFADTVTVTVTKDGTETGTYEGTAVKNSDGTLTVTLTYTPAAEAEAEPEVAEASADVEEVVPEVEAEEIPAE